MEDHPPVKLSTNLEKILNDIPIEEKLPKSLAKQSISRLITPDQIKYEEERTKIIFKLKS